MNPEQDWTDHIRSLLQPVSTPEGHCLGGHFEGLGGRIFGGQAIAQALMAASHKEDAGRLVHSLHACFLRAGDTREPVHYHVTEHLAGRSFANRQVVAMQGGQPILTLMASFHRREAGPCHQAPMRTKMTLAEATARLEAWRSLPDGRGRLMGERLDGKQIEIVPADPDALFGADPHPPRAAWWLRLRSPVTADTALQAAALAYASDIMLLRNAMLPHGVRPFTPGVQSASLDHAIWFHEMPDLNDWLLFETDSPWAGHARGLSRGHFYTADGRMVATVTQESLMRVVRPRNDR